MRLLLVEDDAMIGQSVHKGLRRFGWSVDWVRDGRAAELALQNARKISKPRLLAGLHALRNADDRLKGGGAEARTVMEFLVTQLTGEETKAAGG